MYQAAAALDPRVKLTFTDTDNPVTGKVFIFASTSVKQSIYPLIPIDPAQHSVRIPQQEPMELPPTKKAQLLDFSSFSKDCVAKTMSVDTELQTLIFLINHGLMSIPLLFGLNERKQNCLSLLYNCSPLPAVLRLLKSCFQSRFCPEPEKKSH